MSQPLYPRRPQRRAKKSRRLLLLALAAVFLVSTAVTIFVAYHAHHSIIKNALGLRNIQVDHVLLQTGSPFYTYEDLSLIHI